MTLSEHVPLLSSTTLARADWRFLLPTPALGSVLCVGAPLGLVTALHLVAAEVVVIAKTEQAPPGPFDTVVLCRPDPAELAVACSLLRPGGWLYAELDRPPLRAFRGLHYGLAPLWVRVARRSGLSEVRAYWYVDGAELATHLVPLGDSAAIRHLAGRAQGSLGGGVKVLVLRVLLALGAAGLPARHVAMVAQRPAVEQWPLVEEVPT